MVISYQPSYYYNILLFNIWSILVITNLPHSVRALIVEMKLSNYGSLQGDQLRNTQQWLNIPYADPISSQRPSKVQPVDRFQPPRPFTPPPYDQVVNSGNTRMKCRGLWANEHEDDDCLRLSIWTPNNPENIPILIFLDSRDIMYHTWGSVANNALLETVLMNGTLFADYSKSLVAIVNFRNGPQGFLNIRASGFSKNIGIYDVKMAIEWIKRHASFFGADKNRITLMVASSGVPVAIQTLLETPKLVQRLIILSGNPLSRQTMFKTERTSEAVLDVIGCQANSSTDALESCLEKISVLELNQIIRRMRYFDSYWVPENEKLVRESLSNLNHLDILIGVNLNVGSYYSNQIHPKRQEDYSKTDFYTTSDFNKDIETTICAAENLNGLQCDLIKHEYFSRSQSTTAKDRFGFLSSILLDKNLILPVSDFITYLNKYAYVTPYLFTLDHVSPLDITYGALQDNQSAMGAEIQYLFGMPYAVFVAWQSADRSIMSHMMDMLSKFIHTGKPTASHQPDTSATGSKSSTGVLEPLTWMPYDIASQTYLRITSVDGRAEISVTKNFMKRTQYFWRNLVPRLAGIREDCGFRNFPTEVPFGFPLDLESLSDPEVMKNVGADNPNFLLVVVISVLTVILILLCGVIILIMYRFKQLKNQSAFNHKNSDVMTLKSLKAQNGSIKGDFAKEMMLSKADRSPVHQTELITVSKQNGYPFQKIATSEDKNALLPKSGGDSTPQFGIQEKRQSDIVASSLGGMSEDASRGSEKMSSTSTVSQSELDTALTNQSPRIQNTSASTNQNTIREPSPRLFPERTSPTPLRLTGTLVTPPTRSRNQHYIDDRRAYNTISLNMVPETDLLDEFASSYHADHHVVSNQERAFTTGRKPKHASRTLYF